MKKMVALLCVVLTLCIALTGCSSASKAKNIANDFMKYLKEESYTDLRKISSSSLIINMITEFSGINVINYNRKSVSNENKVKHIITVEKITPSDPDDDFSWEDMFNSQKSAYKKKYPDYEIVIDNSNEFIMQSKDSILSEYTVVYDVQYSNIFGDEKRNSLTLTITQKEPDSDEYQVTEAYGIY